jgi:transposase-like protein
MTFLINIFFWLLSGLLKYQSSTEQSTPPSSPLFPCPNCGPHHRIKNGSIHNGKPKRQGKECGQPFVINPTNKTVSDETKQLIDKLLLERIS